MINRSIANIVKTLKKRNSLKSNMEKSEQITISERLLLLRRKKNFSQREVARQLDLSPTNIVNYERGSYAPSADIIIKLSELFQVSADFLLMGKDNFNIQDEELLNFFREADHLESSKKLSFKNIVRSFLESQKK